jgi:hypothetical protein
MILECSYLPWCFPRLSGTARPVHWREMKESPKVGPKDSGETNQTSCAYCGVITDAVTAGTCLTPSHARYTAGTCLTPSHARYLDLLGALITYC